jgi:hypothetical protein
VTYQQLQQYIKSLKFPFRGDCPTCYGVRCFSASILNGVILYHCYRPSCNLKGKIDYEISIDDLRDSNLYVATQRVDTMGGRQNSKYQIPDYFTSPLANLRCYNFLSRFNLLDLYTRFTDRIRYDPRQNRIVFILKDKDDVVRGAVGRLLVFSRINPRWSVYSRHSGCPFSLGQEPSKLSGLLVEDCISASVATQYSTSTCDYIALLGTSISDETLKHLLVYKKLFIALDDDATNKSIILQKKLSPYIETHIIPLKTDIKYYSKEQFNQLEKEYLRG